jgi:hypothetical protein
MHLFLEWNFIIRNWNKVLSAFNNFPELENFRFLLMGFAINSFSYKIRLSCRNLSSSCAIKELQLNSFNNETVRSKRRPCWKIDKMNSFSMKIDFEWKKM